MLHQITSAALLLSLLSTVAVAAELNVAEARRGVVAIQTSAPGFPPMEGTGFLVSADGLIYTNRHVVEPGDNAKGVLITVGVPSEKDPDTLDYFRAAVVYATPATDSLDFAILKIAAPATYRFKPMKLAAALPELGATVVALGYPSIEDGQPVLSLTKGTVSSTKRRLDKRNYLQTDAAVNPGNSGGPLLNAGGEVVGIVTSKKLGADNIGFALHLTEIKELADAASAPALVARVPVEIGPLDPRKIPKPNSIQPLKENWDIGLGEVRAVKDALILENAGMEYHVVSKQPLPENFQLTIPCMVRFLEGRVHIQPSQGFILRCMTVRFGTDEVAKSALDSPLQGYVMKFSHKGIWLHRQDSKDVVAHKWTGNSDEPMMVTITHDRGHITIAANQQPLIDYQDPRPLGGRHKVSIGGYLSALVLGPVSIVDLDAERASATTRPATKPAASAK